MTHYPDEKDYGVALDCDQLDRYSSIESLLIQTLLAGFYPKLDCTELELKDHLTEIINRYFKFPVEIQINPIKPPKVQFNISIIPETHIALDRKPINFYIYNGYEV